MKRSILFCLLLAMVMGIAPLDVTAQERQQRRSPVKISDIEHDDVQTPRYSVRSDTPNLKSTNKEWLEVRCEFDTLPRWMDQLSITYYVLLKARSQKDVGPDGKKFNMFSGSVQLAHIKEGNGHNSVMYMHPSVYERYGEVDRVAIEISFEGEVVAKDTTGEKTTWWEEFSPMPERLLNRLETPFAFVDVDAYEMLVTP